MLDHVLLFVLPFLLLACFLVYWAGARYAYARRQPSTRGDPASFGWHFFVPCRDEEAVVATTTTLLRSRFPAAHVWVIDDASDDRTGLLVSDLAARDPLVHLVSRRRPHARTGKGAALNAAYEALGEHLPADADRARVVVCVVDADGQLSPDALDFVAGADAFADADTGGVQIGVRMRNADDPRPLPAKGRVANAYARLLIRMQDAEFATSNTGMQLLRRGTGSVGLGGNGQFTRLSALDGIAGPERRPWQHDALLEDYELGLQMRLAGYRVTHLADTWVTQEALPHTRRFLTQRTRWAQGNITCVRYAPRIIASRHYGARGVLESLYTFLQPVAHLATLLLTCVLTAVVLTGGGVLLAAWPLALALGVVSVVPFVLWGPVYRAQYAPDHSRLKGVLWGLSLWLYAYHLFIVSARGFVRLLRGRTGWAKTRRNAETRHSGPVATEA
ncbi:glycosyltransferase family 2 protein [Streptomyces sp. NPDC060194]|uniref:glycosyltransferase family 2 protein n=1 Tax=Streptomyces sp. NPDC060194 TaxID=3347069 RepID=UPI00365B9FC6